jgi:hypothetical protein
MTYIKARPSLFTEDMTDIVTVYSQTTLDNYGKRATSATGTNIAARIVSDTKRSRSNEGETIVEEGSLIMLNNPSIAVGDRLVLPNGSEPIILVVDKINFSANGVTTPHHVVVKFGRS